MTARKSDQQHMVRVVVLRDKNGYNTEYKLESKDRHIFVPVLRNRDGLCYSGVRQFVWDGRETNVMGQPVYRENESTESRGLYWCQG